MQFRCVRTISFGASRNPGNASFPAAYPSLQEKVCRIFILLCVCVCGAEFDEYVNIVVVIPFGDEL